jgi:hypothetical protein
VLGAGPRQPPARSPHILLNDDRDAAEQAAAFLIGDPWDLGKD